MRLFFKHLFTSIKRKPLQPFILVLTLAAAVFVCTISLCFKASLEKEAESALNAQYGQADLVLTLNGQSKSRFMLASEAQELLGDSASVAGSYELVLSLGEEKDLVFLSAVDFYEIGNMFDFEFTAYGEIYEDELSSAILITEDLAKERGLKIGDTVEAQLLSQRVKYTVCGISPSKYLGKYKALIHIDGAIDALAQSSVIASVIGDGFKPCSTLFVNVAQGYSAEECASLLRKSPSFEGKTYSDVHVLLKGQYQANIAEIAISLCVILVCILSAAVIFCCFFILAEERALENSYFKMAGATKRTMDLLMLAEVTVYWLVGSVVGVSMASLLSKPSTKALGLKYVSLEITVGESLSSVLLMLGIAYASSLIFILSKEKIGKIKTNNLLSLLFAAVTLAAMVAELALPGPYRMTLGVLVAALSLLCIFVIIPSVVKLLTGFISRSFDKKALVGKNRSASICYAVKNTYKIGVLHNVSRLGAVLTSVIALTSVMMAAAHSNVRLSRQAINYEYAVVGATQKCTERISACPQLERVDKVYFSTVAIEDAQCLVMSVDSIDTISSGFGVKSLPTGKEAVISHGVAKFLSVQIGDTFAAEIDNKRVELKVKEITRSPVSFVLIDCRALDISPNIIIPVISEGVDTWEAIDAVSLIASEDVASLVQTKELMLEKNDAIDTYIVCGDILLSIIIIFSIVGLADSLYNSYRSRKGEFGLYALSGMSRGCILRMKLCEILLTLMIGTVVGLLCALILAPFLSEAMLSMGNDILIGFLYAFK